MGAELARQRLEPLGRESRGQIQQRSELGKRPLERSEGGEVAWVALLIDPDELAGPTRAAQHAAPSVDACKSHVSVP
jgi:hypothetical protein